jgi:hypothetical protein
MTAFLLIAAAVAAWLVSLWVHPFGRCLRCRGQGHVIRHKPRPARRKGKPRKPRPPKVTTCKACKGIGRRQRPASKILHRLARRVRRELARQHQSRIAERTTSHADRPL